MMQEYADRLMETPTGLRVSVNGRWMRATSSYHEIYDFGNGAADVYILQLRWKGKVIEVSAERRGDQWHLWATEFKGVYPKGLKLERMVGRLGEVERGKIIRTDPEEQVDYIIGRKPNGENIFIVTGEENYELWHPKSIETNDVLMDPDNARKLGWL